jgi:hypothetical protein
MPLTGGGLAGLTFSQHVALFPLSVNALRDNQATGVARHNPVQQLILGLATGLVATINSLTWTGAILGAADPVGTAVPVPFVIPAAPAAAALFLSSSKWVGVSSVKFSQSVIQNMLLNLSVLGLFNGGKSLTVGTGSAVVSLASNPGIRAAAKGSLLSTLPVALKATGVFGVGDVPGAPINHELAKTIPYYAEAYSMALASLLATVPYVGTAATTAAAGGIVTGGIS